VFHIKSRDNNWYPVNPEIFEHLISLINLIEKKDPAGYKSVKSGAIKRGQGWGVNNIQSGAK